MKNVILLFALTIVLQACNKNDDGPEIVTQWQMIEVYYDPGDGSGGFEPTRIFKTMTFFADATIESNMSFCAQTGNNPGNTGTYNSINNTIEPDDCPDFDRPIEYSFNDGNLILAYPCIEPCLEKYERILIR